MIRAELKKENCRFVLQKCKVCGAEFPVIYWFNEKTITSFGFNCEHVPEGAEFYPVEGQPTFEEWYNEQLYVRGFFAVHS